MCDKNSTVFGDFQINYHLDKSFLFNTAIARFHEITNDLTVCIIIVIDNQNEYKVKVRS